MKNLYLIVIMVLTLSFLLIPLLATEKTQKENTFFNSTSLSSTKSDTDDFKFEKFDEIKLYFTDTKKTLTLKIKEYILGVVAAEMSPEYHLEALKAQAITAYTYAYRKHLQSLKTLYEYDLTDDSTVDQSYINEEQRKAKWGEKFNENETKINKVVSETLDKLIIYNNEPILAVYHEISPGKTETAKNVWGTDYPYLQSENSVGDLLCPDFYSEVCVSEEVFMEKISELEVSAISDVENLIGKVNKSQSGTVIDIELNNKRISGIKIKDLFELRSAAFDLSYKNNSFVFNVSGYGHGVGMSQFGANYMAQQGSNYEEIIKNYYRGCEIIDKKTR